MSHFLKGKSRDRDNNEDNGLSDEECVITYNFNRTRRKEEEEKKEEPKRVKIKPQM